MDTFFNVNYYADFSSCDHVKEIYQIFSETEVEQNVNVLQQDLQAMISDFKDLEVARRKDQSHLRKSTAKSLLHIRDLRKKFNDVFDDLEKIAVEEVNTESIKEDDSIAEDLKQSEASLTLLDMGLKQIKISEEKSNKTLVESSLNILNGKKLLKDMRQILDELRNKRIVKTIEFVPNHNIENYISSLRSIGTCKRPTKLNYNPRVKMTSFSVALETGEAVCDIQDAVQTDSGSFRLLDTENKKIKLIDRTLNSTKCFDLKADNEKFNQQYTYEPFGICCISDDEFAVSMVRDKTVNLYRMAGHNLQLIYCISVGEYSRGIAYSKGKEEFFVACGGGSYADEGLGQIRVYSSKGNEIHTHLLHAFQ